MSERLFNPVQITAAAAALGSAAGRTFTLGNGGWAVFLSAVLTWQASATVGLRFPLVQFLDAANNLLYHYVLNASAMPASSLFRVIVASQTQGQVSNFSGQGFFTVALPVPDGFTIPPNSKLVIFDAANIDVADTVQLNSAIYSL